VPHGVRVVENTVGHLSTVTAPLDAGIIHDVGHNKGGGEEKAV